jgi:FkbM family methyltransferase
VAGYELAPFRRRLEYFSRNGIETLIDVGANSGQYGRALRAAGYRGRIVSFEPVSEPYRQLKVHADADPQWECHQAALGDAEGVAEINVARYTAGSSFFDVRPELLENAPEMAFARRESVQVARLDASFRHVLDSAPTALKLDVQGFHAPVLEGAAGVLGDIAAIELEMSVVALYDGEPGLAETINALAERGFELQMLEPAYVGRGGFMLQVDGFFGRAGL